VMGGLVVATLLTLVFLPALYVAWFRVQPVDTTARSELASQLGAHLPLAAKEVCVERSPLLALTTRERSVFNLSSSRQ